MKSVMSNRDQRDTSKDPVTDETATRDFGGSAGAMESRQEREDYSAQSGLAASQSRAEALSRPPSNVQGGVSESVAYSPSAGTGMQGAPMSQPDARDVSSATTDLRQDAADDERNTANNYSGGHAADREAPRDNLPERGSSQESDAF